MATSKLEVLVDFGASPDQKLIDKTLKDLKSKDGVKDALFKNGAIFVDTLLPSALVLEHVAKSSGRRAVLQGFGETQSAVAMISNQSCCSTKVLGVIRLQQTTSGPLIADGSIDGLEPHSTHGMHLHEVGDLSQGCKSIGAHFNPSGSPHGGPDDPADRRHAGDLGNITADERGRATFRIIDQVLKVWDVVGRSIAISEKPDDYGKGDNPSSKEDGNSGIPIACGVIARSAGIFQNPKRICACDGVVVWDEKDRPLAGKGRRNGGCCGEKENKGGNGEMGKINGEVGKIHGEVGKINGEVGKINGVVVKINGEVSKINGEENIKCGEKNGEVGKSCCGENINGKQGNLNRDRIPNCKV